MEWNGVMEIMEALRSILHGFYVTPPGGKGENSSRKTSGFDLWLQGEVQTVNVRIKRSTLNYSLGNY